jgi:hypothetical protein
MLANPGIRDYESGLVYAFGGGVGGACESTGM